MQLVCRDRNRLALEAEIAGAALHGIENICCLTGDDVTAGDEPEARRVFGPRRDPAARHRERDAQRPLPLRPQDRARAAPLPRRGREPVGTAGRPPRRARAQEGARGRTVSPASGRLRTSAARALHGGGSLDRASPSRPQSCRPICLVRSPSALRFVDERVPGISVPAELIERCERAADPEAECFELACELADHARSLPGVRGLHLISFRREAGIARLCSRLGIRTRRERELSGDRSRVAV